MTGWRPGPMPPRPSSPAPRSRFNSTVSAWSSAVWPVRTSGGSTAKRAWRARASRLGPASTGARSDRNPAPERGAASAAVAGSSADCARRAWSTCTAVTWHPAAHASTRRASESAPPETAQVTSVPGGGNVHLGRRSEELTRPHDRQQLRNRAHAELAADATEAGVDVGPADAEIGRGLAHGVAALEGVQQLELLGRQLVEAVAHRPDLVAVGLGGRHVLEPGDVGPDSRAVVGA